MRRNMKRWILIFIAICLVAQPAMAVRVKDLVEIQGVRENRLTGYGLVVGLNGTGDKSGSAFTTLSMANMLRRMGVQVNSDQLKVKNVAAVMVTSSLPPFAKSGQYLDCTVSSIGDSSSLAGGTLVNTALYGANGQVYALCQGPLSVGGFSVSGGTGSGVQKNFPTVGRIPDGALVERSTDFALGPELMLVLDVPDFTTAHRLARSINACVNAKVAHASDSSTIGVDIPETYTDRVVAFVALIEGVDVTPDNMAKVIVDERTGTVVIGSDVKISEVAIAHGNLNIQITEEPQVSQPGAFSGGVTAITPRTGVNVQEGGKRLVMLPSGTTLGNLVGALNAIGVSPRDLVIILQCIKKSGALYADLEVI
ncbi:MAG: flagellar basal body P-ring protein FlgI [Thermodesulfobacteriota bacterium]|nr:flagellar basal body P-ring protein FlgI [Thermodesulfobacteriota bacterium]